MNKDVSGKDFKKIKLLGSGSTGDVYLVKNKDNKLYAMKIINKEKIVTKKKLERIKTEREILSKINHPFIVKMYHDWADSNFIYFILDYCAGGDFFTLLRNIPDHKLSEDNARFYCGELLLALEYLHMHGCIHRDLKLENILIHESGHIMLADFDLAKQSIEPTIVEVVENIFYKKFKYLTPSIKLHNKPNITSDSLVGTYEYLAPEIFLQLEYTDVVDWWSFGVILCEMICGIYPFYSKTKSKEEIRKNIIDGNIKLPTDISISKDAIKLIKQLLTTNPKERLGSEHGSSDIKDHPFFRDKINWALLRNMTPPIIPKIN